MLRPPSLPAAGFRKRLFVWSGVASAALILCAAGLQIADYLLGNFFGFGCESEPRAVFTSEILYALLGLLGLSGGFYAAGRIGPGSPEYTPTPFRDLDPTLRMPAAPTSPPARGRRRGKTQASQDDG